MRDHSVAFVLAIVVVPTVIASFIDTGLDYDTWLPRRVAEGEKNQSGLFNGDEKTLDNKKFSYYFGSDDDEDEVTTPPPHSRDNHRHFHHRKSDNESCISDPGVFQVLDSEAPRIGHKHAPSCILAQMRASFVIPMMTRKNLSTSGNQTEDFEMIVRNKTIVVPPTSHVSGSCGEEQQTITLMWNNTIDSGALVKTGKLTLLFTKVEKENAIFLSNVWADVALFLESGDTPIGMPTETASEASQNLIMSLTQTKMWRTPLRFAYVCRNRIEIKLHANTLPIQAGGSDVIVDPVSNAEAFLVFHELRLETFRKGRFTRHFTHLAYDCRDKWAYNYMPAVVGSALGATCIGIIISFVFRKQLGFGPDDDVSDDQKECLDPEANTDSKSKGDPQDADDEESSREN